jgi:hypothetical protein
MVKSISLVSKDNAGKEVTLIIKKPNHMQMTEAQFYAATIFKKARESGMVLRANLDEWLREQNLWTDKDKQEVEELEKKIEEGVNLLKTKKHPDGQPVKLSEGRQIAVDMSLARFKLQLLYGKKQSYDEFTVEGAVDNARFDFLVSSCVYDEEGNRLFTDVEDYYSRKAEPHIAEAAGKLAAMTFEMDDDWQKKLPENEFLLKYKFVNDELKFVDKDGNPVNMRGEPIVTPVVETVDETTEFEDDVYV